MKEKTKAKKGKLLWLWIAVLGAVVVAAAVVAGILLLGPKGAESQDWKLYWNVDGQTYRAKNIFRTKSKKTGTYQVTLAVDGKQEKFQIKDREVVRRMDSMDIFGVTMDEDGIITAVHSVEEYTGGYAAIKYYVKSVEGDTVYCNTAPAMNGLDISFQVNDNTKIYNASDFGPMVGMACSIQETDQVTAVKDLDGNVAYAFVVPYKKAESLYWNVNRQWDTIAKCTTREPDLMGRYEFDLAYGGEVVTVIAPNLELANEMETITARCFALSFDEETGYVSEVRTYQSGGGKPFASWYNVTDVVGDRVVATRTRSGKNLGATASASMVEDTEIWNVSGLGPMGEATELQYGDLIHGVKDSRGVLSSVFVIERLNSTGKLYWNVERKYDSTTKTSTRTPDADGWYRFKLAVDGKQVVLKTQDWNMVQQMDGAASSNFVLNVSGDEITGFSVGKTLHGGGYFGSWSDVVSLEDGYITSIKSGTTYEAPLAENCEVYNVSKNAGMIGEKTTVQVGDRIHGLLNLKGEVCFIYIVNRFENLPVYYNATRKYNSTTKQTTRVPDAEGYYVFEMAYNGKLVILKTKDKSIANTIDSQAAKVVALGVNGSIITRAISPSQALNTKGGSKSVSYVRVTSVSGGSFVSTKDQAGHKDYGKIFHSVMAPGCKIYNVSNTYEKNLGEVTTLKVNDTVHVLHNVDGQVTVIYVVSRIMSDVDIYWNKTVQYDSDKQKTTRKPDGDGYYWLTFVYKGKVVDLKCKDEETVSFIDSKAGHCTALRVKDGEIIKAYESTVAPDATGGLACSWADIVDISADGKTVTAYKSDTDVTYTLKVGKNTKFYDVMNTASANYGKEVPIQVGQKIHGYKDANKELSQVFVVDYIKPPKEVQHTCTHVKENVTWYEWDGASKIGKSGYYVLTQDADLNGLSIDIGTGKDVTICLNGHTVTSSVRMFKVYGTLTICDHKKADGTYDGKLITTDNSGTASAGIAYLYNNNNRNPVLNIYGGNLLADENASHSSGGLIYAGTGTDNLGEGTVNMYDGVIAGGKVRNIGGNVVMDKGCVFNLYGGTVKDGISTGYKDEKDAIKGGNGGNFYVCGGALLNIEGGTVENGKAVKGGNIYIGKLSALQMSDGVVSGGQARTNGTVEGNGGNIAVYGTRKTETVKNEKGEAEEISIIEAATAEIIGGQILNGYGEKNTGNIFAYLAIVGITDGKISGGTSGSGHTATANRAQAFFNNTFLVIGGGTVEGNVELYGADCEVYMFGNPKITKLTVAATVEMPILMHEHFQDGTSIGLNVVGGTDRILFMAMNEKDASYINVLNSGYELKVDSGFGWLESMYPDHIHCVCGGLGSVGDHTACEDIIWTPWTDSTTLPTSTGNYYLTGDVTLTALVDMPTSATIKLCLNGHKVYGPKDNRIATVRRSLTICDCSAEKTGEMIGYGSTSATASVIYLFNNSPKNAPETDLTIYGGTFRFAGETAITGSIIRIANSSTTDQCTPCTFKMYGGTITGGNATNGAGGVMIDAIGEAQLYGGKIENCTGTKGAMALSGNQKLRVFGDVEIWNNPGANLYLSKNAKDIALDLGTDAKIGVTMEVPGEMAAIAKAADADCLFSDNQNYQVTVDGTKVSLTAAAGTHSHCVCGGNLTGDALAAHLANDHACANVTWTKLTTENFAALVERNGSNNQFKFKNGDAYYYLGEDIDIQKAFEGTALDATWTFMATGRNIQIDLNGHTLTTYGPIMSWNSPVIICDCQGTGRLVRANTASSNNFVLGAANNSGNSVTVYGGTIQGPAAVVSAANGTNNDGKIRIYGGKLVSTGSTAAIDVSVANLKAGFSLDIYGGEVTSENAPAFKISNATAKLSIHGGTFTGTAASTAAGGVTVEGAPKVDNIYLTSGQKITVGEKGLKTGASIGVSMETPGVFSTAGEDLSAYFTSADENCNLVYENGELKLEASVTPPTPETHTHCVCGGLGSVGDHTACEDITWEPWTDSTMLPASTGNYYLTEDVTLTALVDMPTSATIKLCLNGHKVYGPKDNRIATVRRSLTICDCSAEKTGEMIGYGNTSATASVIYLFNNSPKNAPETDLTIYGGTFRFAGETAITGSIIRIANSSTGTPCTFKMYGGTITGGNATAGAGGVIVDAVGEAHLYGGKIENCAGTKGAMMLSGNQKLRVFGDVEIWNNPGANLYLSKNAKDIALDLGTGAKIGVTMEVPGEIATITKAADANRLFSDDQNYQVMVDGTKAILAEASITPPAPETHTHCVCGGLGSVGDHTACEDVTWEPWTEFTTLPASTGNYYLTEDVTLTALVNMPASETIKLCLNGHKVKGPQDGRIATVRRSLTICDCSAKKTGEMIGYGKASETASIIYLFNNSPNTAPETDLTIYGGTFRLADETTIAGSIIRIANSSAANKGTPCTFKMYGGTITGGNATAGAGGVMVENTGDAYLYGGKIENCAGTKGAMMLSGAQKLEISGVVRIISNPNGDLYLSKKTKDIKLDLETGGFIGVTMEEPGEFGTIAKPTNLMQLLSNDPAYLVASDDGVVVRLADPSEVHVHDNFGYLDYADDGSETPTLSIMNFSWIPWNKTDALPTGSGNYYLTEDVILTNTEPYVIEPDETLRLCLNGHTVTASNDAQVYTVKGWLGITDCAENESGKILNGSAGMVTVVESGWFFLYGGTLESTLTEMQSASMITVKNTYFAMYGGTISGGYAEQGGNIRVVNGGNAGLISGTVKDGKAACGGNIYVSDNGRLAMDQVIVSGGQALKEGTLGTAGNGGNIAIYSSDANNRAEFTMYAGGILGGNAENITGNLYCVRSTVNISGGEISGGKAASSADRRDVFLSSCNNWITGGELSGNMEIYGGNGSTTMRGTPKITKLTINPNVSYTISLANHFQEGAEIATLNVGTSKQTRNLFSEMNEADLAYFKNVNSGYTLVLEDGIGKLKEN